MQSPSVLAGVSLRNILLSTDFSSCSETALTYGAWLARRFNATLYVVTVVPQEITDYVQPPDPFYLRHSAEKKMAILADQELLQGIRHREFVKEGQVSETLSALIDRLEIDLIVMGTHGRGGMKKFVLGSVAEEIVNSAPCPVLTIGPRVPHLATQRPGLRKILYVTDLFRGSGRDLAYAEWLAEQEHASLALLHVMKSSAGSRPGYSQSEVEATRTRLARLLPTETPVPVECIVEAGVPGDQILKVAEKLSADLIVMGPHHTAFARVATHLPWITPHEVVCRAQCPVLTVGG